MKLDLCQYINMLCTFPLTSVPFSRLLDIFKNGKFFQEKIHISKKVLQIPFVYIHMSFKMTTSLECFTTFAALIWSFPSVNPLMPFHMATSIESLVTMAALIWCFPSMNPHMDCKNFICF
ncbi:unnamed protein product, partial [Meganyctiphanes norvegica]